MLAPLPGYPGYEVDLEGNFYRNGQPRKATYKAKRQGRTKFNLWTPEGKQTKSAARLVLSAKLGRPLMPFEDACHINGDPTDDRMSNLKASDRLNNIIDELESGRIETPPEYLDLAIQRLQKLRSISTEISEG